MNTTKAEAFTENPTQFSSEEECWVDDASILDMDYFVKTLVGIKAKGVRPELIGSIITHYASKWLPDLSDKAPHDEGGASGESITASWMKKRFCVETLVGILPPEKDSVPCNFILRLLRVANTVGVDPAYRAELEKRASWQLDQASLKELMIPSFSHTCETLLDVELVLRLVQRFVSMEDDLIRGGAAFVKVAKLLDAYLAEAAVDSSLTLSQFVALATALPPHSRAMDDGLYRSIDIYLKAHPGVSKQERKSLTRLIDSRKLSTEASLHAAQNERLPVRAVIQVLFSEQSKLVGIKQSNVDWSGSFSGLRSPEVPARCHSKREMGIQQMEIKRLKEDVLRLQSQCMAMQGQIERLMEKKRGIFGWRKISIPSFKNNVLRDVEGQSEAGYGRQTPTNAKARLVRGRTPNKWRKSLS